MLSMVCDHVGALFFADQPAWSLFGRLAFPIYCFLIANGFRYTHNRWRYLGRLAGLAVLSQIPYEMLLLGITHQPLGMLWQTPAVLVLSAQFACGTIPWIVIVNLFRTASLSLSNNRTSFGAACCCRIYGSLLSNPVRICVPWHSANSCFL